jgi:hypothetical protein
MPDTLDAADAPGVDRLRFTDFAHRRCHARIVRQRTPSRNRNILLLCQMQSNGGPNEIGMSPFP